MCGIIGVCRAEGGVAKDLVKGLRRLEYRGYDSAGFAVLNGRGLVVVKDRGKVDVVAARFLSLGADGEAGIAHTRWATHGVPDETNAHPHLDCNNTVAVVHNGIIENFMELRRELESRGHVFRSETDTEVVAHLVEEHYRGDLLEAVARAVNRLEGSYALAIVHSEHPGTLVCVRRESPLIIAVTGDKGLCASDIAALLDHTSRVAPLEDGMIALVRPNEARVYRLEGGVLSPARPMWLDVGWRPEQADKAGHRHYTWKEILETPHVVVDALRQDPVKVGKAVEMIMGASHIYLVAAGTSYHAALATAYMFSKVAGVPSIPVIASEYPRFLAHSTGEGDLVIAISQSGETADTLEAVREARARGAKILGIVNVLGSTLDREADLSLRIHAGPEIGVAATKSYVNQLALMMMLAERLAEHRGRGAKQLSTRLPQLLRKVVREAEEPVRRLAKIVSRERNVYFLGRGWHVATALEGALKLKELSYIHAEGYPAGESKHGPIALVEEGFPVVFIGSADENTSLLASNIKEMEARGAYKIVVADTPELGDMADYWVRVPPAPEYLTLATHIVPLHMLAYLVAVNRGLDPDKPRNLAKSVTVK